MKTAVEILEQQLYEWLDGRIYLPSTFFEQAKEMEKEQTIEFARKCLYKAKDLDILTSFINVEQYYNETFKSE